MENTTYNDTGSGDSIIVPTTSTGLTLNEIFYVLIGLFGILGNGFVVTVMLYNKCMRSKVTNILIINQSVIDGVTCIFLVVNMPTRIYKMVASGMPGYLHCVVWMSNLSWSCTAFSSTLGLMVITLERYMATVYAMQYKVYFTKNMALGVSIFVWVFPLVYVSVTVILTSGVIDGYCYILQFWPTLHVFRGMAIFHITVSFILPAHLMLFCYTRMILMLRKKIAPAIDQLHVSTAEKLRKEKMAKISRNIFKTMLIVFFFFLVCWTWTNAYNIILILGMGNGWTSSMYYIAKQLSFSNQCVNPVIYSMQYGQFQMAVRRMFCKQAAVGQGDSTLTNSSVRK